MEICTGTCIFAFDKFSTRIRPCMGFKLIMIALAIVYIALSIFSEFDPWWGSNSRSLSHKAEALTILPGRTDKMLATDTTCNY